MTATDGLQFPLTIQDGFDGLYGLVIDELQEDGAIRAHIDVDARHKQPAGLVHGGVYASIAESITSIGTWMAVGGEGRTVQGLSNQTSFVRPVLGGSVRALARPRHRGRTTWVWEVDLTDDEDRLCAMVRMTIAVR